MDIGTTRLPGSRGKRCTGVRVPNSVPGVHFSGLRSHVLLLVSSPRRTAGHGPSRPSLAAAALTMRPTAQAHELLMMFLALIGSR